MPASLRWLALLVALSVAAAIASGWGIYRHATDRSRAFAEELTGGDAKAGGKAMDRYGCGACHVVGGLAGTHGKVAPALTGVATRAHIAGVLPNTPDAMIRWLQHPQRVQPGNGMPELGVTERDARDIAAYLYTLN